MKAMANKLQRYDVTAQYEGDGMVKMDGGDYYRAGDVDALLAEKDAEIERLRHLLEEGLDFAQFAADVPQIQALYEVWKRHAVAALEEVE